MPPQNVVSAIYRYQKPEVFTHYYVQEVLASLARQLPSAPSVAVLTRVDSFAGRISEAMTEVQDLSGTRLDPIDHILYWDPELAAASALVVASILEWPTLTPTQGVLGTLDSIADYYRVKVGLGTAGARAKVTTLERAAKAISEGGNPAAKTAKALMQFAASPPPLTGRAVTDWHVARAALKGSVELNELAAKARLVRLLHATGTVAQALGHTWNGVDGYPGAVDAVRLHLLLKRSTCSNRMRLRRM